MPPKCFFLHDIYFNKENVFVTDVASVIILQKHKTYSCLFTNNYKKLFKAREAGIYQRGNQEA